MDGLKTLNDDETLCWPPEAVTAERQAQHEAEHQTQFFTTDTIQFTRRPETPKQPAECPARTYCNHDRPRDRRGNKRRDYRALPEYYISDSRWIPRRRHCYDRELWLWSEKFREYFGNAPDRIEDARITAAGTEVYQHLSGEDLASQLEHERTVGISPDDPPVELFAK